MLRVQRVSVSYDGTAAVSDLSLSVADGEILALLGPSGCGKSTLLRAIAGIEPLTAGTVLWDGVDLARIPVHRRRFGLVFQDGVLFPNRTVAGNIAYGLRGRTDIAERVGELLDLVGLTGFDSRRVTTLSGGEAQRVALARALAPRPRLLLLDEPMAALDAELRAALLSDLVRILAETGTTAIYVTHDEAEARTIADRVAIMRSGRIERVGAATEVLGEDRAVVVAGAVIQGGRVLVAQRFGPPELAGLWELPGGKVQPGESDAVALARELGEELDLAVIVGPRLGPAVPLPPGSDGRDRELRLYRAEPAERDATYVLDPQVHTAARWVDADELREISLAPADQALVSSLVATLSSKNDRNDIR